MSKCRVAHLIYSQLIGGSEMLAANICANLDREYFDPIILFLYKQSGQMPEVLKRLGVEYATIGCSRFSKFFLKYLIEFKLNKLGVDVLHIHHLTFYNQSYDGVQRSRVKGVVLTEHSIYTLLKSTILQNSLQKAVHNASYFTTVSDEIKEYCVSTSGAEGDKIQVILNGVDTNLFRPRSTIFLKQAIPALSSWQGKIAITVGRLHEAKDHQTMIRAIKLLLTGGGELQLVIVGEGNLLGELERTIESLGLKHYVHLLGARTDVANLLPEADLFLLSSQTEGLPMVLLEAMSCGLPIVSSDVGGIPEVVQDGVNGLLTAPENPQLFADTIQSLLNSDDLMEVMGKCNREKIKQEFSIKETTKYYSDMYMQIMEKDLET